jgi:hypothetical protein
LEEGRREWRFHQPGTGAFRLFTVYNHSKSRMTKHLPKKKSWNVNIISRKRTRREKNKSLQKSSTTWQPWVPIPGCPRS